MSQLTLNVGFPLDAPTKIGIVSQRRMQAFECHLVSLRIMRSIYLGHAAGSQLTINSVHAEFHAGSYWRSLHCGVTWEHH
jgi:hypothetical protein